MKRNRLIATVLAVVMILGLVSVGFAAGVDLPDLEDYEWETEVRRLASLGVFEGYPDGEFKPENTVTRAEFSKMIVCILGLENAANLMKGETVSFSDVDATHWASGYINVAEMKGIVNGYPDGTFKPEGTITHAEALKMILTAMGYLEEGFLVVRWPATWVVQATEIGLDDGVEVLANVPITRGAVAKLLDNGLTEPHVKVTEKGFVDVEVTFMDKLGVDSVKGMVVNSPELWTNTSDDKITVDDKVFVYEDYEGLLGHNVKVWHKKGDNTALVVEDLSTEKAVTNKEYRDLKGKNDLEFFVNYLTGEDYAEEYPHEDAISKRVEGADEIVVVYKGSTPIAVKAAKFDVGTITEIYKYRTAIYVDGNRLDLAKHEVEYHGVDGFDELEKDDVIHYIVHNKHAIIIVSRDAYTGKLTGITYNGDLEVDGEIYVPIKGVKIVDAAKVRDLLGERVTLYLNKDGKVYKIVKVTPEHIGTYAIVQATSVKYDKNGRRYFAKFLTLDGEVEYEVKDELTVGKVVCIDAIEEDLAEVTVLTEPRTVTVEEVASKKINKTYEYTDDTLWLEKTTSGYVVRPRPYRDNVVELYLKGSTEEVVVGIVVKEKVEEPVVPVEPEVVTYIVKGDGLGYNTTFGRFDAEDKYGEKVQFFVDDFDGFKLNGVEVSETVMLDFLDEAADEEEEDDFTGGIIKVETTKAGDKILVVNLEGVVEEAVEKAKALDEIKPAISVSEAVVVEEVPESLKTEGLLGEGFDGTLFKAEVTLKIDDVDTDREVLIESLEFTGADVYLLDVDGGNEWYKNPSNWGPALSIDGGYEATTTVYFVVTDDATEVSATIKIVDSEWEGIEYASETITVEVPEVDEEE